MFLLLLVGEHQHGKPEVSTPSVHMFLSMEQHINVLLHTTPTLRIGHPLLLHLFGPGLKLIMVHQVRNSLSLHSRNGRVVDMNNNLSSRRIMRSMCRTMVLMKLRQVISRGMNLSTVMVLYHHNSNHRMADHLSSRRMEVGIKIQLRVLMGSTVVAVGTDYEDRVAGQMVLRARKGTDYDDLIRAGHRGADET